MSLNRPPVCNGKWLGQWLRLLHPRNAVQLYNSICVVWSEAWNRAGVVVHRTLGLPWWLRRSQRAGAQSRAHTVPSSSLTKSSTGRSQGFHRLSVLWRVEMVRFTDSNPQKRPFRGPRKKSTCSGKTVDRWADSLALLSPDPRLLLSEFP